MADRARRPVPRAGLVVNVDHVAIGPHGVLVVETKWTSHTIDLGAKRLPAEVVHALDQARHNAGRIAGLLQRVNVATTVIPVVMYWGPHVTPPTEPVRRLDGVRLVAGGHGSEWIGLLSLDRLDEAGIDRLANRVRDWRVEHEDDGVREAVAARLHHADRLGEVSIGLTALMLALVVLTRASDVVNTILGRGGVMLAAAVTLLPPVAALAAGAYVWLARQLDPDVPWVPRLIPIGVWSVGFAALLLAT